MVYAKERGLAFRDDSILVQPGKDAWYHEKMAADFSSSTSVILEHDHMGNSKRRDAWGDGSRLLEAVEKHRASYLSIHWWPRELLAKNREIVDRINRRLGYRIVPVEASWNPRMEEGSTFTFSAKWKNAGVAPCLPGGFPAVTLTDAKGGIAAVFAEEGFDVRELPCGPPDEAQSRPQRSEFLQPFNLKPGKYDLFVSIGSRTGTPALELPLEGGDGENRYRLGEVEVTKR